MSVAVERLNTITHETHATMLVLHHLNAAGTKSRGHTSFIGAADTEITLSRHGKTLGVVDIKTSKQKDLDDGVELMVKKNIIEIDGVEKATGEAATSCVYLPITEAEQHQEAVDTMDRRKQLLALVAATPGIGKNELCVKLGGNKRDILALITELVGHEELTQAIDGQRHLLTLGRMERKGSGPGMRWEARK
jgi:hypothetical protein